MRSLVIILLLFATKGIGQDSTHFTYNNFITQVKNNHPIAYRAQLNAQMGQAKLLKAKGGFDPKLAGEAAQKYFGQKNYYSHLHAGLTVPAWLGISVQAGYNNNSGERLNPELYTPENSGLWYAGLTLNLGNGLLMDARRAELKQAEIFQSSSELEQELMLNQLVFDASMAYWEWFKAYNKVEVYKTATENAALRFDAVKESALQGSKPYVDTIKALIQVQERALYLEQLQLGLANKKALLEIYLWDTGFIPLELESFVMPPNYAEIAPSKPEISLDAELNELVKRHPETLISQNKIDLLKIDYRLKKEALKPVAQLKYNALSNAAENSVFQNYTPENYTWGACLSYPVFTRKERGNVKLSALKLEDQETQFLEKMTMTSYKIEAAYNTWLSTQKQADIYNASVSNYKALQAAELTLFNTGESSLFLVNTRDQDMLDAEVKLIEIITQNQAASALFNYQTVTY